MYSGCAPESGRSPESTPTRLSGQRGDTGKFHMTMDEIRASQSTPAALDIASASFSRLNPIRLFRRVVESIQVYAAGSIVRAGEHGLQGRVRQGKRPGRGSAAARANGAALCGRSRAHHLRDI